MEQTRGIALDFSLGVLVLAGEAAVRVGDRCLLGAASIAGALAGVASVITPEPAKVSLSRQVVQIAELGRARREAVGEDSATFASALAVRIAATETVRTVVLSVVDDAMEEILSQAIPATIAALEQPDTVAHTDTVMREMLLRVMPDVLERTLPTSMVRATTRAPVDLVPMLRAAARLDR